MNNAHTTLCPACESLSEDVKNKVALRHYAMPQRLLASRAVFWVEGSTVCKQARSQEKSLEKRIRWLNVLFLERQSGSGERALEDWKVVLLSRCAGGAGTSWRMGLGAGDLFLPPPRARFARGVLQ